MVVSKDPSAPLVVIVGITGQQGGSVANALIESSKSYRLVGLTRDASKPSAHLWIEKGVKLRQVTLSADNKAAAIEAFDGADILFAMTNSVELRTKEKEVALGKSIVDAAKAADVKLFVWANVESPAQWSQGRLNAVWFMDSKGEITDHLRASGVPHALVPVEDYLSNHLGGTAGLGFVKQHDGSYTITKPCPGSTSPVIMEFTGKKYTFNQVDNDGWKSWISQAGYPPQYGDAFRDMYEFFTNVGYYGDKDVAANQKAAGVTPPTFMEMLQNQKPGTFD